MHVLIHTTERKSLEFYKLVALDPRSFQTPEDALIIPPFVGAIKGISIYTQICFECVVYLFINQNHQVGLTT
jgi:hypothetical protein